jgi:hypothetical protein
VHVLAPALEKVPGGHGNASDAPVMVKKPAGEVEHAVAPAPLNVPGTQGKHAATPEFAAKVPAVQEVQLDAPGDAA